jgi:NCS1 family nucleobase:cation symporter-1
LPEVETLGVEPVPAELRTVGPRDLFAINFTFFLNPVMYLLGGLAVVAGGLPLWWAVLAATLGQALAYAFLVLVAQAGTDYGVPGQVALRATLGFWGARLLSSPYRVVAATYWFAAQALAGALGVQAIVQAMTGTHLPLVPVSLAIAVVQAALGVLGLDVMRFLLRVVLPLSVAFTALLVGLYVHTSDPRYDVGRVFRSPDQHLTWVGFATFVTVMCGSSLTIVTNVADFCRYTPSRRDMRVGLVSSALLASVVTTFVGGYAAAATGRTNPFVAVSDLTGSDVVLAILLVAVVVQTTSPNITNVYTAGLSLVNTVPRLGRLGATALVAAVACGLASFPDFVNEAQKWITHLGNVAAPLTGVILADVVWRRRTRLDVDALYDPDGPYRYSRGVNVPAVAAVGAGVAVYYALPQAWLKALWGVGAGALVYAALVQVEAALRPARAATVVEL